MPESKANPQTILVEQQDGLIVITLNRPDAMNTINDAMGQEILRTMESVNKDDRIRAVLLRATGRAFCAGMELSAFQSSPEQIAFQAKRGLADLNRVYQAILDTEKPVICAVNGVAVGGGLALVLCCDLVIASSAARFSVIYSRRGLMTDAGINYLLPRTVGLLKAKELIFTARMIGAEEAERIGLINGVAAPEELDAEALAAARRLAEGPTRAIGLSKSIIHRGLDMGLAACMEWETWGQALCIQTEDVREGMTAFLEKRQPRFKGR